jgi:capsid protein
VPQTRLERALAAVAPAFALKRYESRVRFEAASRFFGPGGYNGARSDRQATKNWTPRLDGPDSSSIPDLQALRARSADLERNDPIAAGATNTTVTSTVGIGLMAHARIDRDYLGLDDAAAEAFERQLDRIWDWWASQQHADVTGRSTSIRSRSSRSAPRSAAATPSRFAGSRNARAICSDSACS